MCGLGLVLALSYYATNRAAIEQTADVSRAASPTPA